MGDVSLITSHSCTQQSVQQSDFVCCTIRVNVVRLFAVESMFKTANIEAASQGSESTTRGWAS